MNYYKVILSHYCSCKIALEPGIDPMPKIKKYLKEQNSGEAKSDRLIFRELRKVTEKEYNECNWPDYQIR